MKRLILTMLSVLAVATCAMAQLSLPRLVSDGMVLQRGSDVKVWGWAAPDSKVRISADWTGAVVCRSDSDGYWECMLATGTDTEPHEMTVSSRGERITVGDILFGEVWICAGQSNMSMPVKGFRDQPVENSAGIVASAGSFRTVRMFTVAKKIDSKPQRDVKGGSWQSASPATVADFSAVGYIFARKLNEELKVPVGMINISMGGSNVQAWVSRELLSTFPEVQLRPIDLSAKAPQREQCGIYNSMLYPSIRYTVAGAIWYQGENNIYTPDLYARMLPAMIGQWRELSGNASMPFYMVEIAPYNYKKTLARDAAFLREAQHRVVVSTPHTAIICAADLGTPSCIHPPKKREVGERLAAVALHENYGRDLRCTFPEFVSATVSDGAVVVEFGNVAGELVLRPADGRSGFEVAGADGEFRPARAVADGKTVRVSSDEVPSPKYVRYAFSNDSTATLFDSEGVPAFPFRTDNR